MVGSNRPASRGDADKKRHQSSTRTTRQCPKSHESIKTRCKDICGVYCLAEDEVGWQKERRLTQILIHVEHLDTGGKKVGGRVWRVI